MCSFLLLCLCSTIHSSNLYGVCFAWSTAVRALVCVVRFTARCLSGLYKVHWFAAQMTRSDQDAPVISIVGWQYRVQNTPVQPLAGAQPAFAPYKGQRSLHNKPVAGVLLMPRRHTAMNLCPSLFYLLPFLTPPPPLLHARITLLTLSTVQWNVLKPMTSCTLEEALHGGATDRKYGTFLLTFVLFATLWLVTLPTVALTVKRRDGRTVVSVVLDVGLHCVQA